MDQKKRRLFLYCIALLFLIIAPITTLYTSGYRYLPGSGIVQFGGLIIETKPKGASVFLNGVNTGQTTPTRFLKLIPGDYNISLQTKGYYDWKQRITIRPRQTNLLINISLFQKNIPKRLVIENLQDITISDGSFFGQKISYINQNNSSKEVRQISLNGNKLPTTLFRTGISNNDDLEIIDYSSNQKFLLIKSKNNYFIINTQPDSTAALLLDDENQIQWAKWDQNKKWIIVAKKDVINFIQPSNQSIVLSIPNNHIIDIMHSRDSIFALVKEATQTLSLVQYMQESPRMIFTKVRTLKKFPATNKMRFIPSPNGYLTLYNSDDQSFNVFSLSKTKSILKASAKDLIWKKDTLLYYTNFEISQFSLSNNKTHLIARYGKPIKKAIPMTHHNQIVYLLENTLTIHELVFKENPNTIQIDLPTNINILDFFLTEQDNSLLIQDESGIWTVKL